MIKHFILIAWRNIMRRKALSAIQILCLAVGLASFILVARYVQYEKDWDKFNKNYEKIYRAQSYKIGDISDAGTQTPVPLSKYIRDNIPEVENAIMLRQVWGEYLSSGNDIIYYEADGYFAPSDVFNVFSFRLIRGSKKGVLDKPNSIVLNETLAKKYFPDEDALGQTIYDSEKNELIITGVMQNIPEQSNIAASYFRSSANLIKQLRTNWYNNSYENYVLLKPNASQATVNEKIKDIINQYDKEAKRYVYLHPLSELHLNESPRDDRGSVIFFFSFIGILTILLACVSFMNLTTAFSSLRSVEIGVRKVSGSNQNFIRLQFLAESLVMAFIAFFFAILIAYLILPFFNNVVNRNMELQLFKNPLFVLLLLGSVIVTGFISGSYPALIISKFKPVAVLKGRNPFKKGRVTGLNAMVYFQFILSVILITTSIWSYKQVEYMKNKDVGFDKDNLLYCFLPKTDQAVSFSQIKQRALASPFIEDASISINSPLHSTWGTRIYHQDGPRDDYMFARWNSATYNYLNTMGMQLIDGRSFTQNYDAETDNCLVNETAVQKFGWNDPLGKWVEDGGKRYQVIGVLKDFNIDDVHNPILPFVMYCRNDKLTSNNNLTFKYTEGDFKKAQTHVNSVLKEMFPNALFEVVHYDNASEREALKIWTSAKDTFAFFTVLAVIIASLGLFGLVIFASQRRLKEIGIRKVQGAKAYQILPLITRQFIILVIIANINVVPFAYMLANVTPGHFKYQFTIYDLLVVLGISVVVTMVASGYQAIKASLLNPVKVLRYE